MFRETLLESSPCSRHCKRWPMIAAFLLEVAVAGVLIVVPLLSTGIIPVSAHVPIIAPLRSMDLANQPVRSGTTGNTREVHSRDMRIVTLASTPSRFSFSQKEPDGRNQGPILTNVIGEEPGPLGPNLIGNTEPPKPAPAKPERVRLSTLSEAQLVTKVEPVYPHIAQVAGISGTVKLHALIGKDGSIESLSLISGHPTLAAAARDAVAKWRYRPYLLNGVAVEVETFITVNFRKAGQ